MGAHHFAACPNKEKIGAFAAACNSEGVLWVLGRPHFTNQLSVDAPALCLSKTYNVSIFLIGTFSQFSLHFSELAMLIYAVCYIVDTSFVCRPQFKIIFWSLVQNLHHQRTICLSFAYLMSTVSPEAIPPSKFFDQRCLSLSQFIFSPERNVHPSKRKM